MTEADRERRRRVREIRHADCSGHTAYMVELSARFLKDYPGAIVGLLSRAIALYVSARYAESLRILRRLLRLAPKDRRDAVQCHFGHLYRRKGEFRRAESWYRKAVVSNPSDAGCRIYLGGVLAVAGRHAEAEAVHRAATKCRVGCIDEAYLNLGFVLRAERRYSEARTCFQKALKLSPKYKEARIALQDMDLVLRMKPRISCSR